MPQLASTIKKKVVKKLSKVVKKMSKSCQNCQKIVKKQNPKKSELYGEEELEEEDWWCSSRTNGAIVKK
jgi:hypothetical protein